jgi:lipopolysaccharide transport system ATP-binding protein
MKARLAFAMIAHIEPEILIIDEALSVGDASFSAKATARILDICARGKIVILVSHGMQSVRDICNRCIYMKDGQIVMDGSPEDVTKAYIEEVRGEDEAALMQKFPCARRQPFAQGRERDSTGFLALRRRRRSALFVSRRGRDFGFRLSAGTMIRQEPLYAGYESCGWMICWSFSRIFGWPIFPFMVARSASKSNLIRLRWCAAIYRLDTLLFDTAEDGSEPCAEYSTVFEIFTLTPPTGGRPMLYYPITAAVQP